MTLEERILDQLHEILLELVTIRVAMGEINRKLKEGGPLVHGSFDAEDRRIGS